MDNGQLQDGACVYILKTSKKHYKIGKTKSLQKRLAAYRTHLPIMFRVIRQYLTENPDSLEEALHVIFQHKRVKGEWFSLVESDLIICDNMSRGYAGDSLPKKLNKRDIKPFSNNPLLQVIKANEKYLKDYSVVADDLQLGMSTNEIMELHEGAVSKTTIQTVRRLLQYQTPNATFISKWLFVVNDLQAGMKEKEVMAKYPNQVSRSIIATIKRIMKHQLY